MKRTIWDKRLPTLLGVLFIMVGIGVTSQLVKTGVVFIGRALPSEVPENIRITNISDASFTVSYTTEAKVLGTISFGKDENLGNIAVDDRDQNENLGAYQMHHITVKELSPSTKYFFAINSGQNNFTKNNLPFDVTTAPGNKTTSSSRQKVTGKVINPDATVPSEAIIYLSSENTKTTSSLLKEDGSYSLFAEDAVLQIIIVSPSQQSNVTVFAKQANPVPLIILSKNYDFTTSLSPIASGSETASPAAQVNFPALSVSSTSSKEPQIITPKKDEGFSDVQPLLKGSASPNSPVKIIINSETTIEDEVVADSNGSWSYRPKQELSPGQHTITITAKDKFGILKSITQSFTVYAQGTQVNQSATPSATPTLALTPSPTSTPSASPTPTETLTPTPTPTLTPTPTKPPSEATKGEVAAPGNETWIKGGLAAFTTMAIGALLFFLTRGSTSL